MSPDDLIGIFLYGLEQLHVDDNGLKPGTHDADDLSTVGALSVAVYRIAARGDTPHDCALSRLAVLTGGLLGSQWLGDGKAIARQWLAARAEFLELQLAGNC